MSNLEAENRFWMLVEGPKQYEKTVMESMGQIPELTTTTLTVGEAHNIEDPIRRARNRDWSMEKDRLAQSIDSVVKGVESLDGGTLGGFLAMHAECKRNKAYRQREQMSDEKFVLGSLHVFQKTYEEYAQLEESPITVTKRHETKVIRYKRLYPFDLTPRDIRVLIARFGLDGMSTKTIEEVAKEELLYPLTVRLSTGNLVWALRYL